MSRLYLRIYLALVASLVVLAVATVGIWHRVDGPMDRTADALVQLIANALPPATALPAEQQAALERLARDVGADASLFADDRTPLAVVGRPLYPPRDRLSKHTWLHPWHETAVWSARLPDGRRLAVALPIGLRRPGYVVPLTLGLLALTVGVAAFPIVRRLTQRLERLQRGVESLGAGNLAARVAVEGKDEVARLAESFNLAAARIENLVAAHKDLLANASHELRTPLARIRLAVELLKHGADAKQKAGLEQDIAELDRLIGEILLASRLDAVHTFDVDEDVDLLALAAEECARYPDARLDGVPCTVRGDPHLLRRLLRNLLENAARHGRPPIAVTLAVNGDGVEIVVEDDGPGVPAAQRERVFEPFFRRPGASYDAGTGLGLALVRRIATRHGGDARCVASHGGGSRFVVALPLRR